MQLGNRDDQADLGQPCAQFLKRHVLARLPDGKNAAARPSARRERISQSYDFGAKSPVSIPCASQRIAVEDATPNRSAAVRQLSPPSTAARRSGT